MFKSCLNDETMLQDDKKYISTYYTDFEGPVDCDENELNRNVLINQFSSNNYHPSVDSILARHSSCLRRMQNE